MVRSKIVVASVVGSGTTVISSGSIEGGLLLVTPIALTMSNKVNGISFDEFHEGLVQLLGIDDLLVVSVSGARGATWQSTVLIDGKAERGIDLYYMLPIICNFLQRFLSCCGS